MLAISRGINRESIEIYPTCSGLSRELSVKTLCSPLREIEILLVSGWKSIALLVLPLVEIGQTTIVFAVAPRQLRLVS